MYQFHVSVHAIPGAAAAGPPLTLGELRLQTLEPTPAALAATPIDCTFEDAYERLEALPRMFIEPDGSWVWTSPSDETRWQVDGHLYDRAERLHYVELKGNCPAARFDQLLAALGWPRVELVFQLVREAVVLTESEFRRHAARR